MRQPSFARRHPTLTTAMLAIVMVVGLLALLEGGLALRFPGGDAFSTRVPKDWIEIYGAGLQRTRPNQAYSLEERVRATGELVFAVTLHTDELGRRRVPIEGHDEGDRFLLFFGGSYVQGWGLEDDETLPAQVAARAPRWRPYNYGLHEQGAGELLAKLESGTLRDEVTQQEGMLIYVFTDADRDRAIGSMRSVSRPRGSNRPYYRLTSDGHVERDGTFASGRPLRTGLYRLLGRSRLLALAGIELRPGSSNAQYRLIAGILATARDRFHEQFPGQPFVVLIFPDSKRSRPLIPHLERLGVTTLDWAQAPGLPSELTLGKGDPHPNRAANAMLAERLVETLGLR